MTRKYTEFDLDDNGNLRITLLDDAHEDVQDIAVKDLDADNKLAQVIEWQLGNGWSFLRPEDVGALTDAPILSEDVETDEQGNVVEVGSVYWYPGYDVHDPVEQLLQNGFIVFQRGES